MDAIQEPPPPRKDESSQEDNGNTYWPSKLPAPEVLDRLGSSVTISCRKLPNAQYTFQWTKSYRLRPSWKDAEGGICTENPGKRGGTLLLERVLVGTSLGMLVLCRV